MLTLIVELGQTNNLSSFICKVSHQIEGNNEDEPTVKSSHLNKHV